MNALSREFDIERVSWSEGCAPLTAVRQVVYVDEQGVPPELEWNEGDDECDHVLARARDGSPIGTGRIARSGQIGRLAVLAHWRGRGVGAAILCELLDMAEEVGLGEVFLHGQTRALSFYEPFGFVAEGDVFMDANIPHRLMRLSLPRRPGR